MYLWFLIFFSQPHKEERFLFPIYPFIALGASVFISAVQKIYKLLIEENIRFLPRHQKLNDIFVGFSCLFSILRSVLLVLAYGGAMNIYSTSLFQVSNRLESNNNQYNLCLGKEWHRFGTHFLVPEKFQVHFIESEFKAQLPAKFRGSWPKSVQSNKNTFNDDNLQDMSRYTQLEDCDFLIEKESKFEQASELQPKYSESDEWEVVDGSVWKFLNAENSKWWARLIYIPYVFEKFCEFDDYLILMRK